jgi:hypothetical protein
MSAMLNIIAASRRRVDPDAADYFARIVSAGSSISAANRAAVDVFVRGCKADGIWSAIKACCLLAGPDDLTGALVPLVGAAPTNFNFVAGDYNRTTGLVGDGSTKYLNTNRNNNADPRDNNHNALWVSSSGAVGNFAMGGGISASGANTLGTGGGVRSRFSSSESSISSPTKFFGISRSVGTQFTVRAGGTNYLKNRTSDEPANANVAIFSSISTTGIRSDLISNGRYSFYSIGESLDLALLDARISTYMASIT